METPELIILDEPFSSLDEDGIETVSQLILKAKERGALVIVACHDFELLSFVSDEIFKIVAGKITKHSIKTTESKFVEAEL